MTTPQLIADAWNKTTDTKLRDRIIGTLAEREKTEGAAVWPSAPTAEREQMAGLYPDPADPQFAARLFTKREFHESRAVAAGVAAGTIDPCSSTAAARVFELTPVQRLVSRFMHPLTPYMGLLLFHGVGVGKTCSAVTIAEQFLETNPNNKVIVIVPQALKENFKRTVFNPDSLTWDEGTGQWTTQQCTGTSYLERLDLLTNPDLKTVAFKANEDRLARYTVTGYQAFANWIEKTLRKSLPVSLTDPDARREAEDEILRRLFSDHVIIVDEAHNLRDSNAGAGAAESAATGEAAENAGGKSLNPFLRRICLKTEGVRLVLMTATPMYNSAPEIVLLLNYLILNDTKQESSALRVDTMFTREGELMEGLPQRNLERAARAYVSYMRGENPFTFPLRMHPLAVDAEPASRWPEVSATKNPVKLTDHERSALNAMPLIFTEPLAGSPPERVLRAGTTRAVQALDEGEGEEEGEGEGEGEEEEEGEGEKISDVMLDLRMQMANITYPNEMYGSAGWDGHFTTTLQRGGDNRLRSFTPKAELELDAVFSGEGLQSHAPKIHSIVESVGKAQGICFIYSRYIKSGALPIAAALERAGFQRRLADGSLVPLLTGVAPVPPVCAICNQRPGAHAGASHKFRPACYVLLTSEEDISPKFAGLVRQATSWKNDPEYGPMGSNVKVIIGSQVASEGLDLKCVREMHILDAWYHLNRTDQIIGRAIRYCSHSALRAVETRMELPLMSLNNTLIYLHALRPSDFESADMYAYRIAIRKALAVGRVQRLLKRHAWDCNLELEAIVFTGLPSRPQIDAQGNKRQSLNMDNISDPSGYSPNDTDFTTYCDYQACYHQCAVSIPENAHIETSTFSVSDVRRLILAKQDTIRNLFMDQVMLPVKAVQAAFGDLPYEIASAALMELIDGRRFRLRRRDGVEGFLIIKADYVVFQPAEITDRAIPMTMRYARGFQLRRRMMDSAMPVMNRGIDIGPELDTVPLPRLQPAAAIAAVEAAEAGGEAGGEAVTEETIPTSAILERWNAWTNWVLSRGTAPAPLEDIHKLWIWIFERYGEVVETPTIALRWWFDRLKYAEQRALLEIAMGSELGDPLTKILAGDIFRSKTVSGYRVYNPMTMAVEYYCMPPAKVGPSCNPQTEALIERALNKPPVAIMTDTGPVFGFIAAKAGEVVFKTLDKTQPIKPSSIGAECGNTSNLTVHYPRIAILQSAVTGTDLAPLMLPYAVEVWDKAGSDARKKAGRPQHIKDITHQPLCLYMEFLTRLLDARRIDGKRWFLTAAAGATAGLKGKVARKA